MPAMPFSAFIICRDEADRIGAAIDSVKGIAAEVVVVDSGSTDGTRAVAARHGARVVENPWPGYGPQKRFAEDQCRHDWLLNLDADERLTPALADEIAALLAAGTPPRPGYVVRIVDVFAHESRPAPLAYAYRQIRLYDRRAGRFSDSPVHDTVRMPKGLRLGRLRAPMEHRSMRSISFMVDKLNRYSDAQVAEMAARGRRIARWRLVTEFPLAFLKAWIIRRNAVRGWWGLAVSGIYAWSRFMRVAKAYEAQLGRVPEAGRPRAGAD